MTDEEALIEKFEIAVLEDLEIGGHSEKYHKAREALLSALQMSALQKGRNSDIPPPYLHKKGTKCSRNC